MGGVGEQTSGDLFLAFSTGNRIRATDMNVQTSLTFPVSMLSDSYITAIFDATVEATEEAILNCLLSADTMTGKDGITAHRLPPDRLVEVMRKYNRPAELPAGA
jgi:D-aminopeptidase